jgi:hypothetical protein
MPDQFPIRIPDDDAALALAMQFDAGLEAARKGVQDLNASFADLPFEGCPEDWTERPFARIVWKEERGDRNVGIADVYGWCLAEDQTGTIVAQLAALDTDAISAAGLTTPTPEEVLADPAASNWLKTALQAALRRDPVDAANEAEVLSRVLAVHAEKVLADAGAQLKLRPKTGRR